jgi:hypothetical protein
LSRNVGNYHSTLRNIPQEQRSQLHRGGSLKSPTLATVSDLKRIFRLYEDTGLPGKFFSSFKNAISGFGDKQHRLLISYVNKSAPFLLSGSSWFPCQYYIIQLHIAFGLITV